jgi:hypothetical protein
MCENWHNNKFEGQNINFVIHAFWHFTQIYTFKVNLIKFNTESVCNWIAAGSFIVYVYVLKWNRKRLFMLYHF